MLHTGMLPHMVTVTSPARVMDGYGDESLDYGSGTTRTVAANVQIHSSSQSVTDSRDSVTRSAVMLTRDRFITAVDHVEHDGVTYQINGAPIEWATSNGFSHVEIQLTVAMG